MLMKVML
jgi:hypothetical protein